VTASRPLARQVISLLYRRELRPPRRALLADGVRRQRTVGTTPMNALRNPYSSIASPPTSSVHRIEPCHPGSFPKNRERRASILATPRMGMIVMMPKKARTKPHQFHSGRRSASWNEMSMPTPRRMMPLTSITPPGRIRSGRKLSFEPISRPGTNDPSVGVRMSHTADPQNPTNSSGRISAVVVSVQPACKLTAMATNSGMKSTPPTKVIGLYR